jgi:hypothetical protein
VSDSITGQIASGGDTMLKHLFESLLNRAEKVLNCVGNILNSTPDRHAKIRQSPIYRGFNILNKTSKGLVQKHPFVLRKNVKAKGASPHETRHFNQPK